MAGSAVHSRCTSNGSKGLQPAAALEQVGARVGRFGLVTHDVGQPEDSPDFTHRIRQPLPLGVSIRTPPRD